MSSKRPNISSYIPFGGVRIKEGLFMGDFFAADVG